MSTMTLLGGLRDLQIPLAHVYPYTAALADHIRRSQPGWHREFADAEPLSASLPMRQARDFAFMRWCEQTLPPAVFDMHVSDAIAAGPSHLAVELANTVAWAQRHARSER
jgi:hypothetical protein